MTDLNALGVIAEFNPFHNGHRYLIDEGRKKTHGAVSVVVMSGDYVQRGEPAIFDKWTRAHAALTNGADLVVTLPFFSAVQPADRFANGAVELLATLKCRSLVFGTEEANFDYSQVAKKIVSTHEKPQFFTDYKKTYATQLNEFFQNEFGLKIDQANHMLGISYAIANEKLTHPMSLIPINRIGSEHDSDQPIKNIASASYLRQHMTNIDTIKNFLPSSVIEFYQAQPQVFWQSAFPFLKYRIQSSTLEDLQSIYQMSEGLEYRLKKVIGTVQSFEDLLQAIKSKRYTFARLRRLCLYVLLNVKTADMINAHAHPFIQVLGFNQLGQKYLHQIKKELQIPLITKLDAKLGKEVVGLEVRVDNFYQQLTNKPQDFGHVPIMYEKEA